MALKDALAARPNTLGEAQRKGSILATFQIDDRVFAVTKHTFHGNVFIEIGVSGYMSGPETGMHEHSRHTIYIVHEVLGDKPTPKSELAVAGAILLGNEGMNMKVDYAALERQYRGIGLGRAMYRTAINDLVEHRYIVASDVASDRSEAAEGVWRSLARSNPEAIMAISEWGDDLSEPDEMPDQYWAWKFVERRPVRVRHYRRTLK
jgi:ribosomal protein S18 acetylase RimI-like enzyme